MKFIIIGGVAGGATAAARLRRLDEKAEIILLERGKYVSYANCGLPYYIGGTIADRDKLLVQTVGGFMARYNVDIRTEHEVTRIDRNKKCVVVHDIVKGVDYEESYDKLILSPGAAPLRPRIEGIDNDRIFTLRNIPDTDAIKSYVDCHKPKSALIVGGGFIGLEMAHNLRDAGLEVAVVEMARQVMMPIDFSMAQMVHRHLIEKGVDLRLSDGVSRFVDTDEGIEVFLQSGNSIVADMVVLSIGVRPETSLAKDCGLEIGETGGIKVNEFLQTSDVHIYAIGDAVEVKHKVSGLPVMIPLAGPANKQGRIVADNVASGNSRIYEGSIGTSIAKVFDFTVACAGLNAKTMKKIGMPYISSYTHSPSHAGYYPGGTPLTIKILFAPADGQLLGAQVVGFDGVDKRIEMLAQVIQHRGTIYDLMDLEHAYAPPYSSAKDPVNMAGFVADDILNDRVEIIQWHDLQCDSSDCLVLDVRTADEFAFGSFPNAVNIPVDDLRGRMNELPRDKKIVVSCAIGLRGYVAYRILKQSGFDNVVNLAGGYKTWQAAALPLLPDDKMPAQRVVLARKTTVCNCEDVKPVAPFAKNIVKVDACGLQCPGPVMSLKKHYSDLKVGDRIEITSTDQAFGRDVASWCKMTGARLMDLKNEKGVVRATIQKEEMCAMTDNNRVSADGKTVIVFSDDLDKALASFVIANGAAATGKKVTMFFTFWGLNVIKKQHKPAVEKDIFGKMFGWMLPSSSKKLGLSKMNMMGIGSKMMRTIMGNKKIDSLESMIAQAQANGIEMIACTMSMDVMGVRAEELLDGVTLGGVATYLERAEQSNVNLFI